MQAFSLADVEAAHAAAGARYHQYLTVPEMSAGLYVLPAGATDEQQPHEEDEIYYVLRGRARVRVAQEDRPVVPGDTVFVARHVEHRFYEIEEDLALLVVFAPAHTV